jgi:hypothetical protein
MKQKLVFLIFALITVLTGAASVFAQSGPPPQMTPALADLSQRLGQTINVSNLTNWSYEQLDYPTTALGCDLVTNGIALSSEIPTYHFTINLNGQVYDYRVSADNTIVVACNAAFQQAPVPTVPPAAVATLAPLNNTNTGVAVAGTPQIGGFQNDILTIMTYDQAAGDFRASVMMNDGIVVPVSGKQPPKWSSTGAQMVFLASRGPNIGGVDLYSMNANGSNVMLLAEDVVGLFDISADGQTVYYAKVTDPNAPLTDLGIPIGIFSVPITGGSSQGLAAASYYPMCGGGFMGYPAEVIENFSINANPPFFEVTAYGLVFSASCANRGLTRVDLQTGAITELGGDYARSVLSDDGTRIAAIQLSPADRSQQILTIIDLTTNTVMPLGAAAPPDFVTWGPNGDLFYSTHEVTGQIIPGSDSPTIQTYTGQAAGVVLNMVTIHRIDLTAATDSEIYRADGYEIRRLDVSPDGSGVFFTTIPNGDAWVAAINASPNPTMLDFTPYFPVALSRLDLASGNAFVLMSDFRRFVLNDTTFN